MNITATAVAVTLALVVAVAFLFFGPAVLRPFSNTAPTEATSTDSTLNTQPMTTGDGAQPQEAQGTQLPNQPQAGQAQAPQPLPTTLTVSDVSVGTGEAAKAGDVLTMNYVGALPNGTVFDASAKHGQPFTFTLGAGQVIPGWDQGLVGMKVGGKRRLIIPPSMAYGNRDLGSIPPNSTLIFEVVLVKIGK